MVLKTRAKKENWPGLRTQAEHRASTRATQKVAEKAADNAVSLQQARAVAIAKVNAALEAMPEGSGSHVRRQVTDAKTGLPITMDYDLPALVQALAKLGEETQKNAGNEREEVTVIIDV